MAAQAMGSGLEEEEGDALDGSELSLSLPGAQKCMVDLKQCNVAQFSIERVSCCEGDPTRTQRSLMGEIQSI